MNYIREAIEYLKNYKNLKVANENLRNKIKEIGTELEGYKPINYSGMPTGGNNQCDDKIINLIFEKDKLRYLLAENEAIVWQIQKVLNNLPEEELNVITSSYVEEEPEALIIDKLKMSRATYYRIRGKAIRSLAVQLFGIKVIS